MCGSQVQETAEGSVTIIFPPVCPYMLHCTTLLHCTCILRVTLDDSQTQILRSLNPFNSLVSHKHVNQLLYFLVSFKLNIIYIYIRAV